MPGATYPLEPQVVPPVDTPYRRIQTKIPVPESLSTLEDLRRYEPLSMTGQPLVVWDRAEGCQVHDKWGNMWLDWSSGVLVTNAGHGRKELIAAICEQARHGLLHNYCFPSEHRAKLAKRLVELAPEGIEKCFLLTTGSEATECAVKLARTHGLTVGGREKIGLVSFQHAFHGRTLGAQMIGGIPSLKEWIVNLDPAMVQVAFPDGFRCPDTSFDFFLKQLDQQGVAPSQTAGVITETYQGGGASFAPPEYIQALRAWCDEHDIVLIMDEVQAAFGRTGTHFWGFQHYGILPDLICCGKGISSSLPLSCVLGKTDLMDQYPAGSMTSTHTGNPVCCAAALASLDLIVNEKLVDNATRMGALLHRLLGEIKDRHPGVCASLQGKGLVAGLHLVKPGGVEPDPDLAFQVVKRSVEKGLLFFSPVGFQGATVKISPPLTINEAQVREGAETLEEALGEALGQT
ncbi:MAG: aspartate aminotransferase family protein [Armatimonadetes bacterium CG_4_10_14_3_um_filter_66_18]|nr:aspartate aminotransferase family protein [Armatimonadota bacterium]PIY51827.1 MAG: aspartate aminotransferase family protein [Armatimonadetes bacterium CG_4_10_14_3_um_filter_66_18]PIZ42467.1 MAG: aspartate aminotransferase family protein [Armatimonadetes bacterium CG_4_10_14_0_8_um_filter_66_14]PJB71933.1 MAG: aspartate aminotransferase family protein [Armatimonadetes bacterium CG_4_9_14_3_um_filter_66_14]